MKNFRSASRLLALCAGLALSLHVQAADPVKKPKALELASGSALVVDLQSNEIRFAQNPDLVMPIASITKLMTAVVTLDGKQPLDEQLSVSNHEAAALRSVFSRVRVNSQLSRRELLQLTLMASENRAAATLAHHYPGGTAAFVTAMNAKAKALGMASSHFVEPSGLDSGNVSTARDLLALLKAARQYPLILQMSTTRQQQVTFSHPRYSLGFSNTNPLVRNGTWDVQLSKTGFHSEAGRCLVMITTMANRQVAMVLLDAFGKYTHVADANRLRRWLETGVSTPVPAAARNYRQQRDLLIRQQTAQAPE
ncbi:D-alanyl-D-alanine endopeptidase [Pseudomonas sp. PIC25]|uniref:D-alanyl-D-alanine endopeptidase n=1 Tax=Pseudomonas sp. PIC25 TaxID=1958773 RepID=UPI000BABDBF4|nr:D-alanyl-D-alanine endopeptidase [Pseudomonas sp. PIC25]PAU66069.1 D-alanyl-D-alanine endopeptidase [Pseudomonas sp. PIC25]